MNRYGIKAAAVALASVVLGTALAACGSSSTSSGAPSRLRIAYAWTPSGGLAIDSDDGKLLRLAGIVETLVDIDAAGAPVPGLASSWHQVDERTWDFTLRAGVEFHDGEPLTADAVVTAIDHVTSVPALPRTLDGIGMKAQVLDAGTVRISTEHADPVLLLRMSGYNTGILAPKAYESTPPPPIGTGPFVLTGTQADGSLVVDRNEHYWGGKVALDGAEIRFLSDPTARISAIAAGDVDIATLLPATAVADLAGQPGFTVRQYPTARSTYLLMNNAAPELSDLRVRQAVSAAIDRNLLLTGAHDGVGTAADTIFGGLVPFGSDATPPPADPQRARQLLAEAGYDDAHPLVLDLWAYPERPELPDAATVVQRMLADAGIQTTIKIAEAATLDAPARRGEFDLMFSSRNWLFDFPDAGEFLRSDYGCNGSYNLSRVCLPALDQLLDQLATTTDTAARAGLLRQAAEVLATDAAVVPLVHTSAVVGVSNRVTGFVADSFEYDLLTTTIGIGQGSGR
ncbi:MAG: ABC transporter substrate-binding protein [Ilumatobacteraceae bacterium]